MHTGPFEIDLDALKALPPEQQREELARIGRIRARLEKNPMWLYVPHEGERGWKLAKGLPLTGAEQRGQVAYHEIDCHTGAFVAGNRAGKTHGSLADDLIQTLPLELLPPWLHKYKRWGVREPFKCRVVGQDLPRWLGQTVLPKLRKMIPKAGLWKGNFDRAYDARDHKLQFADGAVWDFLTHDMSVDAFASVDLHRVHFDEEPVGELGRQQYEESCWRIIDYDGEIRWSLTPLLGLDFVYDELNKDDKPRWDDDVKVVLGDIDHNPHLSESGRRKALKNAEKDPLRYQARKSGRWVHFAGLIYSEWRDDLHIVPDRDIPRLENGQPAVPIFAAIDPGINKDHQAAVPMAWVNPDGQLEVFRAWKAPDCTVEDVAQHFHETREALDFRPRWTVIDPAAQNRNHATGRNLQQDYARHGIPTMPGQNSRVAGYNRIKERLAHKDADGEPHPMLVVQASCVALIDEFHKYRWKLPKGTGVDKPKAEPIKRNDDLLDALRYLVMQLPPVKPAKPVEPEERLSGAQKALRDRARQVRGGRQGRVGGVLARS